MLSQEAIIDQRMEILTEELSVEQCLRFHGLLRRSISIEFLTRENLNRASVTLFVVKGLPEARWQSLADDKIEQVIARTFERTPQGDSDEVEDWLVAISHSCVEKLLSEMI